MPVSLAVTDKESACHLYYKSPGLGLGLMTANVDPETKVTWSTQRLSLYVSSALVSLNDSACWLVMVILPRAASMAADQKTSPIRAGMYSRPPIRSPYFRWNGSSIVTYPSDLILLAKNKPPEEQERQIVQLDFRFSLSIEISRFLFKQFSEWIDGRRESLSMTISPMTRLMAYPKGAWHQASPRSLAKMASAVPLM